MQHETGPKLKLVYSRTRIPVTPSMFRCDNAGIQASLFAEPKSGLIVFVWFSQIYDTEFIDVIQHAQPSFIIDLRLAPRFDVGSLNREFVFELFAKVRTTYVDATTAVMMGKPHVDVMKDLSEVLSSSKIDLNRPIVFLLGTPKSSLASDAEILSLLSEVGKQASEVVTVPAYQ
jgi:hypothetical protein